MKGRESFFEHRSRRKESLRPKASGAAPLTVWILTAVFLPITLVAISTPATEPELETKPSTLVVGIQDMDFFPYLRSGANGRVEGYLHDLLDRFAAHRGYRLELVVIPLKRLFLEAYGEEIDLFTPDNPGWSLESKRDSELYYSRAVTTALDGFAVLPGQEHLRPGPELEHVGTMLGFTIDPVLPLAARELLLIDRSSRFESLFQALLLGRIDAVYCNVAVARHTLASLGHEPRSVSWSQTLPRFKSPFHVSSRHRDLIRELDDWMAENEAVVKSLKRRHQILAAESTVWGDPAGEETENRSSRP